MTYDRVISIMLDERVPENYINRLAEFWPEPREQLHFFYSNEE
ncbi:MAG: hypothetical protein ACW98Y_10585 [Candidatus Thorarchaeota archaeon]|jgi:hypothetical protein